MPAAGKPRDAAFSLLFRKNSLGWEYLQHPGRHRIMVTLGGGMKHTAADWNVCSGCVRKENEGTKRGWDL